MATKNWSKFPKTVYVAWEDAGDDTYLAASENYSGYAVVDDERPVAVYQLVEVKKVKAKAALE
jgi:hypothetical protein